MVGQKKPFVINFADTSGGVNNIEHPSLFNQNQVHEDSSGFMLKKSGVVKSLGSTGLSATDTFTDYLRLLTLHRQFAGTESMYALSGGTLSAVNKTNGALTSKFTMGEATKEGWATDSHGKKWICNGNKTVKIEGTTAYQVGITAPSGITAAAAAGAGLPDGTYYIYVSYARKVSGANKLYSSGQLVAAVTLGSGNNQIAFTFANSSDAQVNNKVVWLKSPSEAVHYFFYETDNNTTTSFTITGTTAKNTSVIYEYAAMDNGVPPAITYIYAFAGRLWGIINNIIYYSDIGDFSEYSLEIWRASNYQITPHKLTGIFSVGQNLYFNSEDGILLLPSGDINQMLYLIESRWHFEYMRTVAAWNGGVIGVTNQGVRLFDGQQFTSFDFAYPIRSNLIKLYNSAANFQPCGFVYRRNFRDEYHLMWQDTTYSATTNNIHAVLNLSSAYWQESNNYNLAWEFQLISGNYAAVSAVDNTLFVGQSHETASKVYKEDSTYAQCSYVYNKSGTLLGLNVDVESKLRTREFVFDISALMWVKKFYVFAQNDYPFTIHLYAGDNINKFSEPFVIAASGGTTAAFDSAVWDTSIFPSENAASNKRKLPTDFKCRSLYVTITQTDNDYNFKLLKLLVFCEAEMGNYL